MKRTLTLSLFLVVALTGCGVQGTNTAVKKSATSVQTVNSCTDSIGIHVNGSTWTCEDGCNKCKCNSGNILSTMMSCGG